jgi:hypothetical protein
MRYVGRKAIAALIVNSCVGGDVLTTDDMREIFELDEAQAQFVKREARKIAIKWGILWSYDPEVKGFRVCPEGDDEAAARMTAYSYRLSGSALTSTSLVVGGSYAGGFTDKRTMGLRRNKLTAMMVSLEAAAKEIEES